MKPCMAILCVKPSLGFPWHLNVDQSAHSAFKAAGQPCGLAHPLTLSMALQASAPGPLGCPNTRLRTSALATPPDHSSSTPSCPAASVTCHLLSRVRVTLLTTLSGTRHACDPHLPAGECPCLFPRLFSVSHSFSPKGAWFCSPRCAQLLQSGWSTARGVECHRVRWASFRPELPQGQRVISLLFVQVPRLSRGAEGLPLQGRSGGRHGAVKHGGPCTCRMDAERFYERGRVPASRPPSLSQTRGLCSRWSRPRSSVKCKGTGVLRTSVRSNCKLPAL